MKTWLCLGHKDKKDKCLYSRVNIIKVRKAKHPNSNFYHDVETLTIWCEKKQHMITRYIVQCDDFQNQTLEAFHNEQ